MISRLAAVTVTLALVGCLTTGCQPEPDPSPSGPAFATEEEAFAAAEETYRAYVDALNQRRVDPKSQPDPQIFLTGQALEVDIDTQQQLDQSGIAVTGPTIVSAVSKVSADVKDGSVRLEVCLDSTGTRVLNTDGDDVTPVERQTISLLEVDFLTTTSTLISASNTKALGEC